MRFVLPGLDMIVGIVAVLTAFETFFIRGRILKLAILVLGWILKPRLTRPYMENSAQL
jgi:hypothetical protein